MLDVKGYGDINVNEVVRFRQIQVRERSFKHLLCCC